MCDVDSRLLVSLNSVALRVYYFTTPPVGFYFLLTRRGNVFKFETFMEINNLGVWSTEVGLQKILVLFRQSVSCICSF